MANTETKAEGEQEEPIKKERKPDEPAYAPKGALVEPEWPPFGRYPYAWIGLTIVTLFLFGYTWFIFREEKMIERYEFMKWGGTLDRIHSLQKIRKYLIYDSFGIIGSGRMSEFGLADTTVACFYDESPEVRKLAVEVFCGFTANTDLQKYLVEDLKGVEAIRRFAFTHDAFVWYALANLSEHNIDVCKEISSDEYFMDALLTTYERSLMMTDYHMIRPIMRLLMNLAEYRESAEALSSEKYQLKLRELLSAFLVPESQTMSSALNLRVRLAKHLPERWPYFVEELIAAGVHEEQDPELTKFSLIRQSLAALSAGIAWSLFRAYRMKGKFDPMSRSERAWVRSAVWRSPLTAVGLSFALFGIERISGYVSKQLSWETFRDARYAFLPYFLTVPLYWVALNYAGPFATIPSLIRVRENERLPPFNYKMREPIIKAMQAIGVVDEVETDPSNYNRLTTHLGQIIKDRNETARLQKEDVEKIMKEQQKKKWFW